MTSPSFSDRVFSAVITSSWFVAVYNFTNWVTSMRSDIRELAFTWEKYIPFVPILIIPYWSIDLFFVAAPFIIRERAELRLFTLRVFAAIGIAGLFFLAYPLKLQFQRPVLEGMLGFLFGSLDNMNNYWNLAPSLHIALWVILWAVYANVFSGFRRLLLSAWFLLIGLSTLLCWQHHIFDVFTGWLLGLFVLRLLNREFFEVKEPPSKKHFSLAARYLIGALLTGLLSMFIWPIGLIFLWPLTAFLLLALAYFRNDVHVLGKTSGKLDSTAWWIFLPYRLLARCWQKKYLAGDFSPVKICSGLSLGPMPNTKQLKLIEADAVLDLTSEYPASKPEESKIYFNSPMLDLVTPSIRQLAEALRQLEVASRTGAVYMHCALGLGRSATVAAAWLIHTRQVLTVQHAMAHVRQNSAKVVFSEDAELLLSNYLNSVKNG